MTGDLGPVTFTKRGRRYLVNGEYVPSVTTILKDGFPSPALITWAARETAAAAVDQWEALSTESVSVRLKTLERAAWAKRDAAALRGTEIHALGEALVKGEEVEVPEAHRSAVEGYARFLDQWHVVPTLTETPVCHPVHGWAGTTDLRATLSDGADWLLDLKTGKGIYESHVLQLAAYAHAVLYLDPEGGARPWTLPDRVGAIHVTPEESRLVPVEADDRAYAIFRHAAVVAGYARKASQAYRAREPWPVGRPLVPPGLLA